MKRKRPLTPAERHRRRLLNQAKRLLAAMQRLLREVLRDEKKP